MKRAHLYVGKSEGFGPAHEVVLNTQPPGPGVLVGLEEHRGRASNSCDGDAAGTTWGHWEGSHRLGGGLQLSSYLGHPLLVLLFATKKYLLIWP